MKFTKRIRKREIGISHIGQQIMFDEALWHVSGEGGWLWWEYWELTFVDMWPRSPRFAARTFLDRGQSWPPAMQEPDPGPPFNPIASAMHLHSLGLLGAVPAPDSSSMEEKRYKPDPALYSPPLPLMEALEPTPAADHYSAPDPAPSFDPGPSMDSPSFDSSNNV